MSQRTPVLIARSLSNVCESRIMFAQVTAKNVEDPLLSSATVLEKKLRYRRGKARRNMHTVTKKT